jgi:hypothetical protein
MSSPSATVTLDHPYHLLDIQGKNTKRTGSLNGREVEVRSYDLRDAAYCWCYIAAIGLIALTLGVVFRQGCDSDRPQQPRCSLAMTTAIAGGVILFFYCCVFCDLCRGRVQGQGVPVHR